MTPNDEGKPVDDKMMDEAEILRLADRHHDGSSVIDVVTESFRAGQASRDQICDEFKRNESTFIEMLNRQETELISLREENEKLKAQVKYLIEQADQLEKYLSQEKSGRVATFTAMNESEKREVVRTEQVISLREKLGTLREDHARLREALLSYAGSDKGKEGYVWYRDVFFFEDKFGSAHADRGSLAARTIAASDEAMKKFNK